MATTSSSEGFLTKLDNCRLFTPDQMQQVREWIEKKETPDRKALLRRFVEKNWITRWQAEEIYAGRYDFFMGTYKLVEKLGAGGRGTVYKAAHISMNRTVALKVMAKELVADPEAVARFRREVESAAALNHPNVIAAYDAAQEGETHFLVMEYVVGRDLNSWLKEFGKLPINWACECIRQAAVGLQHAHERGLVHRDIKPANILVAAANTNEIPQVKVLDLGCALFQSNDEQLRLTQPWQTFGTPDYMSPEQAESARKADIRSDVFSLGCTLFKLLAGEVPYSGATQLQKLLARASHAAPSVLEKRPDCPPELAAVVAKMLERKPEDRFQTPGELAAALAKFSMVPGVPAAAQSPLAADFNRAAAAAAAAPVSSSGAAAVAAPAPPPLRTAFQGLAEPPEPELSQFPFTPDDPADPPAASAPSMTSNTTATIPSLGVATSSSSARSEPRGQRAVRISQVARSALFAGAAMGGLIGGVLGGALAAGLHFGLPASGDAWQVALAACLAAGAALGGGYRAAVAAALAASE